MTPAQLAELEQRLGLTLPRGFRDVAVDGDQRSGPLSTDGPFVGLRPFLIWNLRARDDVQPAPWNRDYFVVGHDGCGNAHLVDVRQQAAPVVFHDHETGELLEVADSYEAFLRPGARSLEDHGDEAIESGTAVIALTETVSDSILNPIRLQEWTALVEKDPAFSMLADRIGVNPLTQQVVRFPRIGAARWRGSAEAADVELVWGALHWPRPGAEGEEKARLLAQSLGARLLRGWDVA
jgi:hypothetical protein